jgi:hypothetical protein
MITAAVMLGLLFAAGYWIASQPPRRRHAASSPVV